MSIHYLMCFKCKNDDEWLIGRGIAICICGEGVFFA